MQTDDYIPLHVVEVKPQDLSASISIQKLNETIRLQIIEIEKLKKCVSPQLVEFNA